MWKESLDLSCSPDKELMEGNAKKAEMSELQRVVDQMRVLIEGGEKSQCSKEKTE